MTFALFAAALVQSVPAVAPAPPTPPPPLNRIMTPAPPSANAPTTKVADDEEAIEVFARGNLNSPALRAMDGAWPKVEALRREFKARTASIFIDRDGALVLRLLGDQPVAPRRLVGRNGVLPVRFIAGAKMTDRQAMMHLTPTVLRELGRRLPDMSGASVDPRTGELAIMVVAKLDAEDVRRLKARDAELEALIGAPVRVEVRGPQSF